ADADTHRERLAGDRLQVTSTPDGRVQGGSQFERAEPRLRIVHGHAPRQRTDTATICGHAPSTSWASRSLPQPTAAYRAPMPRAYRCPPARRRQGGADGGAAAPSLARRLRRLLAPMGRWPGSTDSVEELNRSQDRIPRLIR